MARVAGVKARWGRPRGGKRTHVLEVIVTDGSGQLSLTFFNQAFRERQLSLGRLGLFSGRVGSSGESGSCPIPRCCCYPTMPTRSIRRRWPPSRGLSSRFTRLRRAARAGESPAPSAWSCLWWTGWPIRFRSGSGCAGAAGDRRGISLGTHARVDRGRSNPPCGGSVGRSLRSAVSAAAAPGCCPRSNSATAARGARWSGGQVGPGVPFRLTEGQAAVAEEIRTDMAHEHPMMRLLQG